MIVVANGSLINLFIVLTGALHDAWAIWNESSRLFIGHRSQQLRFLYLLLLQLELLDERLKRLLILAGQSALMGGFDVAMMAFLLLHRGHHEVLLHELRSHT